MTKKYIIIVFTAMLLTSIFYFGNTFIKIEEPVFNITYDYSDLARDIRDNVASSPDQISEAEVTPVPSEKPTPVPSQKPAEDTSKKNTVSKNTPKKNYSKLLANIKSYLSNQEGVYGIYFLDLTSGQSMGLNSTRKFIAASTVKVPINLYLYKLYSEGGISLDETVTYTEADYEEGTGDIQYQDFGTEYSLRELSRMSIEISDNVAINMLSRYLDYEKVVEYMEGLEGHSIQRNKNQITPKDMAVFLKTLLDLTQNNPDTHELLDFMLNTEFNDRIPLLLPPEVPVAHKIGNQVEAVHDVGIVFAQKPYILCLYSEKVNEDTAPDVLAQISKMVYDFSQN